MAVNIYRIVIFKKENGLLSKKMIEFKRILVLVSPLHRRAKKVLSRGEIHTNL